MDAVKLSQAKLDMLRLLLKDPKIKSCIIVDGSYAGEIKIKENGDILLGKSKHGWVNRLFNSYKEFDFFTIASKIAVTITGGISKNNSEWAGMLKEIADKSLVRNDREQIIDLLFQWVVLFDTDSIYASKYIRGDLTNETPNSISIGKTYVNLGGETIMIPITLDKIR